jgi:glycosyltransferase involved in cell wall biosynthesis
VDHAEIGRALLALIDNPTLRQTIARTGRARAERLFEIRDLSAALDAFLVRVVANYRAARPPASNR